MQCNLLGFIPVVSCRWDVAGLPLGGALFPLGTPGWQRRGQVTASVGPSRARGVGVLWRGGAFLAETRRDTHPCERGGPPPHGLYLFWLSHLSSPKRISRRAAIAFPLIFFLGLSDRLWAVGVLRDRCFGSSPGLLRTHVAVGKKWANPKNGLPW